MPRYLKWLAVLTSFDLLLVLLGGALVTKTGSGQGCGKSWPLCNGEWFPWPLSMETIIELSHRLVSGSAALLVLALCILAWRKIGHIRETKFLAIVAFLFLIAQALIGAAAVVWGQSDIVLAAHFGISLISFASVLLLTLLIFEVDKKFDADAIMVDKRMKFHIYGVTIYSYLVVYTGAFVRHKDASLACPSWPMCSKYSALPTQMHEWIQMGHRFAAGLIFIWVAYATVLAIRHYKHQRVLYRGWIISFILVSLQVIAGALVVVTELNLTVALLHSLFISCLFGVLSYLVLLSTRSTKQAQTATTQESIIRKKPSFR
ncbi:heme A synthase [Bacillus sp. 165]|uniref:COX15/CtaA family protein n=1 Tax=Bacillus sp. 165 TaxID=1529117 RepID=UPI001ADA0EE6|nr:heme A synthase [Bacillus sp. 165]MBO9130302.1 heme A synthase [Bacillus sp. 165]